MELNLRPKDGKIHIFCATYFGSKKYMENINKIIENMQDKGYEIIDVKLSRSTGNDYSGLITYK